MKPQNNASRPSTKAALSEESLSELVDVVCRHPLHRELYLKLLGFCTEERTVDEAEIFLEAQPEYADALQTSTVLVNVLIDHGGLEYEEYDETGEKLTEARIEGFREQGLSEGEIYDAIERRCVRATEEGRAVTNLLDPVKRVRSYLASDPSRTEALLKLLAAPNARGNQRAVRRRPRARPTRENKLAARSCELPHRSHERGRRALLGRRMANDPCGNHRGRAFLSGKPSRPNQVNSEESLLG